MGGFLRLSHMLGELRHRAISLLEPTVERWRGRGMSLREHIVHDEAVTANGIHQRHLFLCIGNDVESL